MGRMARMAHRMGHPGHAAHPEVQRAVHATLARIAAAGRTAGVLCSADTAEALAASGARLLLTRVSDLLALGTQVFRRGLGTLPGREVP
jgi:2-keto-3-deoxy-L-rhamnonate aldolase RhmA